MNENEAGEDDDNIYYPVELTQCFTKINANWWLFEVFQKFAPGWKGIQSSAKQLSQSVANKQGLVVLLKACLMFPLAFDVVPYAPSYLLIHQS